MNGLCAVMNYGPQKASGTTIDGKKEMYMVWRMRLKQTFAALANDLPIKSMSLLKFC